MHIKSEVPTITYWNSSQDSGKLFTYIYQFIIKDNNGGTAKWKKYTGLSIGVWGVHRASISFLGAPPSQHLNMFTSQEASQTPSFKVFMQIPSLKHDSLNIGYW